MGAVMKKKQQLTDESRPLGHVKLEPRRLLNADFDLTGTDLVLDNFINSDVGDDRVNLSRSGDIFSFVLDDGVWNGDDTAANIAGAGTNTLTVDISLGALTSLLLNSNSADQFDIRFGSFDFSGTLDVTNVGPNPQFGTIDQTTAVTLTNTLTVSGADSIDLGDAGNDFTLVNISNAVDVNLVDANAIEALVQ